jgi:hypothetical protein
MTIFDAPNRDLCEVRRQKTNTPLQALALQNDVQVLECAKVLASNVASIGSEDEGISGGHYSNGYFFGRQMTTN